MAISSQGQLVITDLLELQVLHNALFAAKFECADMRDELRGSPHLAAIQARVYDGVVSALRRDWQEGEAARWEQWRAATNHPHRLEAVRGWLRQTTIWSSWSVDQKAAFVRDLLSPLEATAAVVAELIEDRDAA
jgi:hypothetical protein